MESSHCGFLLCSLLSTKRFSLMNEVQIARVVYSILCDILRAFFIFISIRTRTLTHNNQNEIFNVPNKLIRLPFESLLCNSFGALYFKRQLVLCSTTRRFQYLLFPHLKLGLNFNSFQ